MAVINEAPEIGEEEGNDEATDTYHEASEKALALIILCSEESQLVHLSACVTGKAAWEILQAYHQVENPTQKIRIMKQLFTTELSEGASMVDHLQKIFELFHKLTQMNYHMEDDLAVAVLLASLNSQYDALVTALEGWDDNRRNLQSVRMKLIEEWRKREADNMKGVTSRAFGIPSGLGERDQRKIKKFSCFHCSVEGHMKKDCPLLNARVVKESGDGATSEKLARYRK